MLPKVIHEIPSRILDKYILKPNLDTVPTR